MKKLIVLAILHFLLSACSGTGQREIVNVPGQNVSFISPPSNWRELPKSQLVPPGENVPEKGYMAGWRNNNFSTIVIAGINNTESKKEVTFREAIEYGIKMEMLEFEKSGISVKYSITNETNGLKEGVSFTTIEAEINYTDPNSKELKKKAISYDFESSNYSYTLDFRALDFNYDKDIIVFKQLLDSIKFVDQ